MRRLRVAVLDLVAKKPERNLHARTMNPNIAGIMPQVVAVWCEQAGHRVRYVCYTGLEDIAEELSGDLDIVFMSAFTTAAQFAAALSATLRRRGVVTVLGGPHARCYPDDACKYFDYVVGFTDRDVVETILRDCVPQRPGAHLSAGRHPETLPCVAERWKFIEHALRKALTFKLVPMIGSLGCPYTCTFCIDAVVEYRPLDFDQLRRDLRFVLGALERPRVAWHDPNFGVRFDDFLDALEDAVPPGRMEHVAESSLSLLSEPHVRRMARNGFTALLPGIESWFDFNDKSKSGARRGEEKLRQVADQVNMILRHVPYVQANFILGLDSDGGPEPFELTKRFVDLVPGAYPALSPLIAYGELAPLNVEFQRDGRVVPLPFHFLNNRHTNLRLKHYGWTEFYDRVLDLHRYAFSLQAIARRLAAQRSGRAGWLNVLRAVSADGWGRARYYRLLRGALDSDRALRRFLEGESTRVPTFFLTQVQRDLGRLWTDLPAGALEHDPNAYIKKHGIGGPLVRLRPGKARSSAPAGATPRPIASPVERG